MRGSLALEKVKIIVKEKKAFSLSCIIQHSVFAKKRIRNLFFQNQSDKNKSKTNFFFFYQEKESKKKKIWINKPSDSTR